MDRAKYRVMPTKEGWEVKKDGSSQRQGFDNKAQARTP